MKINQASEQYQSLQGPELIQIIKLADKDILKNVIIPALSWNQIYFLSLTLEGERKTYLKYSCFPDLIGD